MALALLSQVPAALLAATAVLVGPGEASLVAAVTVAVAAMVVTVQMARLGQTEPIQATLEPTVRKAGTAALVVWVVQAVTQGHRVLMAVVAMAGLAATLETVAAEETAPPVMPRSLRVVTGATGVIPVLRVAAVWVANTVLAAPSAPTGAMVPMEPLAQVATVALVARAIRPRVPTTQAEVAAVATAAHWGVVAAMVVTVAMQ